MSAKTYKMRAIVLKKTKLAEKDLIVTFLSEEGALAQGVAKGARRPGGSFAARLELFGTVDVMMARGRSLDVVADARRVDPVSDFDWNLERSSYAAPVAELLAAVAQPELEQPRVFDMARAAFARIGNPGVPLPSALAVAAAALWKIMAQIGYRPSFSTCVLCGIPLVDSAPPVQVPAPDFTLPASGFTSPATAPTSPASGFDSSYVAVSIADGGVVCASCQRPADAIMVERNHVRWCEALIATRFDDIVSWNVDPAVSYAVLELARQWSRAHTGKNLKSLDFLFTL